MDNEDVICAARKMIELYGKDAEIVAMGHSETLASCDRLEESLVWESVAVAIRELCKKRQTA
jgi:hypothetical protein